jgi:hypothetical protein
VAAGDRRLSEVTHPTAAPTRHRAHRLHRSLRTGTPAPTSSFSPIMDKLAGNSTPALPVTAADAQARAQSRPRKAARKLLGLGLVSFVLLAVQTRLLVSAPEAVELPLHAQEALDKCRNLHTLPAPPPDFNTRSQSDRFVEGTKAVSISRLISGACMTKNL